MTREFNVPGKPQGKQRPRITSRGICYTPKETVVYENWIKTCYLQQGGTRFEDGIPLVVRIDAYFCVPASWPKSKRAAALRNVIRPTGKPDADNIIKAVCDSLNGVAYKDDAAVVSVTLNKLYGDAPRVAVTIEPADMSNGEQTKLDDVV